MRALDPERFAALRKDFPGDDLADILRTFAELTAKTVADVAEGAASRDAARTREAAHKLRGGCLAVGALRLARTAGELEEATLGGTVDDHAAALAATVQDEWALLQEDLASV